MKNVNGRFRTWRGGLLRRPKCQKIPGFGAEPQGVTRVVIVFSIFGHIWKIIFSLVENLSFQI